MIYAWALAGHYLSVVLQEIHAYATWFLGEEKMVLPHSAIALLLAWSCSEELVIFRILFHQQWRLKKLVDSAISYTVRC